LARNNNTLEIKHFSMACIHGCQKKPSFHQKWLKKLTQNKIIYLHLTVLHNFLSGDGIVEAAPVCFATCGSLTLYCSKSIVV
jgi:hypothetical protein